MDPLGLALENFNALGMWRETERKTTDRRRRQARHGRGISRHSRGQTSLGHRAPPRFLPLFDRKMLTYALGRGMEYYDTETVDQVVDNLQKNDGHFSALLSRIIDSAPSRSGRNISSMRAAAQPSEQVVEAR